MFWKRIVVLAALWAGLTGQITAQSGASWIQLNGVTVHPTHILARMRLGDGADLAVVRPQVVAVLATAGLSIQFDYSLVPGLVVIDTIGNEVTQTALTPPAVQAQMLQDRITFVRSTGLFDYATVDAVSQFLGLPDDRRFVDGTLWGLQNTGQNGGKSGADISAVSAWQVTTGTNSVVVAVMDSGIRYTHKDLAANMWVNTNEIAGNGIDDDNNGVIDDVYGYNAVNGSGNPFDDFGHGTHVSGTIGAAANNGYPHVGICWNVSLMAIKIGGQFGILYSDAIKGIQYASKMGARIANNSWGGPSAGDGDQPLIDAINSSGAKGLLYVAAAGNNGTDDDVIPFAPASLALPSMLSVAALDRKDNLASFSCFGRKTVNLGAPGVEIFSCWAGSDTDYLVEQGTSMACPHVVGVAALTLAAHPKASMAELRQRVLNSAVPIPALAGLTTTGGRVNAYNAVNSGPSGSLKVTILPVDGSAIRFGQTNVAFTATVSDIFPITNATVNCSVTDPSGNSSPLVFVNDGTGNDVAAGDNIYSSSFSATNVGTYSFLFTVNAPKENGVIFTNSYTVVAPPANDDFARPQKIPSGGAVYTVTNTLASIQTGEPVHAGISTVAGSLWYAYSPIADGPVLVDTLRSGVPSVLAVYTGSTLRTLKSVAAAAGTNGNPGVELIFQATKGATYWIVVASVSTNSLGQIRLELQPNGSIDVLPPQLTVNGVVDGLLTSTNLLKISGTAVDPAPSPSGVQSVQVSLNGGLAIPALGTTSWTVLSPLSLQAGQNVVTVAAFDYAGNKSTPLQYNVYYRVPTQANDAFALATVLTDISATVKGSNVGATKEPNEPEHAGNSGGHSVWWVFTPPFSGLLSITLRNSDFDTLLGVYTGDYVNDLTLLAANDDSAPGISFSALQVAVTEGIPVHIAVDGFGGATGNITLAYHLDASQLVPVTLSSGNGGSISRFSGLYPSNSVFTVQALPNAGFQFAGWTGTIISFDNPLTFLVKPGINIQGTFIANRYSDDFESGDLKKLPWVSSGSAPWFAQTNTASLGKYAAQSGAIGDSGTSVLSLTATSIGGSGTFDYKVSSEAGFDYLGFYIDGTLIQQWSGEIDWSTFGFSLPVGLHTFEWRYSKDSSGTSGQDASWIDNVQLHLRSPIDSTSTPVDRLVKVASGNAQIYVTGQLDQVYLTQYSQDLKKWGALSTNVNSLGSFLIQAPVSTNSFRFYRTIVAP